MDKKLYLIILSSILIIVISIIIYIIIKDKKASSTELTQEDASSTELTQEDASSTGLTQEDASSTELTQEDACKDLGLWNDGACTKYESFTDGVGGTNGTEDTNIADITEDYELFEINNYFTPSQIINAKKIINDKSSIFDLPLTHLWKGINLEKLGNFSVEMNKGFIKFSNILNDMLKENIDTKLTNIYDIMITINLVLYYKKIKKEDNILFCILFGLYCKVLIEEQIDLYKTSTTLSVSLTKCLPENNLILYVYNKSKDDLEDIECDTIETIDAATFIKKYEENQLEPHNKIYSSPLLDLYVETDAKYIKTLDINNITEYNIISDAYLNIIKFYIDNSTTIDTFSSLSIDTIKNNRQLIINCLDLIIVYVDAIMKVLPNLESGRGGYTIEIRDNLQQYVDIVSNMSE